MTAYELIQELAQFKPDTPVDFHVKAEFNADVEVEVDIEKGDLPFDSETVSTTTYVKFDEDVSFDDIKSSRRGDVATIYLEY